MKARSSAARALLAVCCLGAIACGKSKSSSGEPGSAAGSGSAVTGSAAPAAGSDAKPAPASFAKSLAAFYASKHPGVPCPLFAVGDEVKIADWTLRVDGVSVHEAEAGLPWIRNVDERSWFQKPGRRALVVRYSVRNDTPLKKRRDFSTRVQTSDGERATWFPYNMELYEKEHGLTRSSTFPPSTWVATVGVLGVAEGVADNAAMWLSYEVSEFDPTDPRGRRKISVIRQQAVVDLGKAAPGPHLNPAKR